jgi:hypothetical protein
MRISRIDRCLPDGIFIAGSLAPDVNTLVALADGHCPANSGPRRLSEGESLRNVVIRITKCESIRSIGPQVVEGSPVAARGRVDLCQD